MQASGSWPRPVSSAITASVPALASSSSADSTSVSAATPPSAEPESTAAAQASAAQTIEATPAFMSQVPRPYIRPVRRSPTTVAANGSVIAPTPTVSRWPLSSNEIDPCWPARVRCGAPR